MAIKIVSKDLLKSDCNLIVHQVNCKGKMNSGIAKQIREQYPLAYEDYMYRYNSSDNKDNLLGNISLTLIKEDKYIVNMFSQLKYGYDGERYTNYEAIYNGLEKVYKIAKEYSWSVAIPYNIGSDRGGAAWSVIYEMIKVIFKDEVEVEICKN